MLHLDPDVRGKWIKLGLEWVQLKKITKCRIVNDAQGRRLVIDHKDKKGAAKQLVYRGNFILHIEEQLKKHGGWKD